MPVKERRLKRLLTTIGRFSVLISLASCRPQTPVTSLPSPRETLADAGKRLIRDESMGHLTVVASRADRLLSELTTTERDALARGYLRFRIDRHAEIMVAVPRSSVPFWIADLGFRKKAHLSFRDHEIAWDVYSRIHEPGWVGLGVNGLDRRPPAHYAVIVRSVTDGPVLVSDFDETTWQSSVAESGASLATDRHRPIVDLPGELRGMVLLRSAEAHRHDTMLARGRVWKTHVVSKDIPDQITVAFGTIPGEELAFSWRTSPEARRSVLKLRPSATNEVREVEGTSESIELREVLNDPVNRRHTVSVNGLRPNTSYEYTVGDGKPETSTPWLPIKTAPRPEQDVQFLYMGDPQCGLEGWGKLLASARKRHPDASALLIAGDLVDRGNERTNWDHFFLRASGVFESIATMPAVGNHEYLDRGPWLYRSNFRLPPNGPAGVPSDLVYSFEMGDAIIAVLDSTLAVTNPREARRQADWLDETLSKTRRTWKLVMFHHPIHASHPTRENLPLQDAWVPLFDKHHVDLVLQGHDHAYLRTYPLRSNRRVNSTSEGTIYVVSVSGDKYCDQDPRDYTEVGFTHVSTYQTIDIIAGERRLVYRSFDASGRERDAFAIRKETGPAPVVEGLAIGDQR